MPRVTRSSAKENVFAADEKAPPKKRGRPPKRKNELSSSGLESPNKSPNCESNSIKLTNSSSISPIREKLAAQLKIASPETNKFSSARRALADNPNFYLPGREVQFSELSTLINDLVEKNQSASLYINGPPGTGKTATIMKFINGFSEKTSVKIAFINSTSISSIGAIYKKICGELSLKIDGKSEKECLLAIEKYLASNHKPTLIVLDEIDQLCSAGKDQNVLYHIFEWPSLPKSKLILIGIANSLDLTDRFLTRLQAKCELKPKVMHFPAYTKEQIVNIFKSRLEQTDLFPPATIQLLAAKVASVSGDIRRALNIGRRVIEVAELEKKKNDDDFDIEKFNAVIGSKENEQADTKVSLKEVITVLNAVYGGSKSLESNVDEGFPLQQKILICTLLLIIKHDKNKDITVGRLHDVYKKVCKNRNIQSVELSEFSNLCILVETRGIIRLMKKKEPRFHKINLQWNEDEVFEALKDKQMITNILNDKTLLSR